MILRPAARFLLATVLTMIFGMTGCVRTRPVTFYTLSPLPPGQLSVAGNDFTDIRVGIGPVRFSKLIDRPQIVTRTTPNRVDLADFHRWGGDLGEDFLIVLTNDIRQLCGSGLFLRHPWPQEFSPRYRVEFDVHQFDGALGGTVVLNVTWLIRTPDGGDLEVNHAFIEEKTSGDDYVSLVEAESRALEKLSRLVVEALANER
jgi:hypothetical protein